MCVSVSVCVYIYTCFWQWGLWCDRLFVACQPPAQDSEPPQGLTPRTARGSALCQAQKAAEARKTRRVRHGKRTICTVYREVRQREPKRFAERKEKRGTCRRQSEDPLNSTRHKVAELNWGIGRRCVFIFRPRVAKERSFGRLKVNSSLMQRGERLWTLGAFKQSFYTVNFKSVWWTWIKFLHIWQPRKQTKNISTFETMLCKNYFREAGLSLFTSF